ncbi:MAG: nucleotidyltransferase domain-containing protein [Planctomycetes bacterium]|nr:nucleotidyltransferase domain-containing protein [Planctomycetota bacterium]
MAREFRPRAIILFGSQATGRARWDSDVDWLVIAETKRPLELAARILGSLNGRFPLDVLVRTPREVQRALQGADPFVREVVTTGRVLYEAKRARVD